MGARRATGRFAGVRLRADGLRFAAVAGRRPAALRFADVDRPRDAAVRFVAGARRVADGRLLLGARRVADARVDCERVRIGDLRPADRGRAGRVVAERAERGRPRLLARRRGAATLPMQESMLLHTSR